VTNPTRVRCHYSLSAREVDILQHALTAPTTHPNGMGDIDPRELIDLSDYLGVIPVEPAATPGALHVPPATVPDTTTEERP
jgi:hypothetical protein